MYSSTLETSERPLPSRRTGLRKLWLKVHLYLALSVGFMFVLMGLTGSVNVFWKEIDELLNPELVVAHPQGEYRPLKEILKALHTAHPGLTGGWDLRLPYHGRGMLTAWYLTPCSRQGQPESPLMVSVNPYTAKVVKSRYWDEAWGLSG